MWIKCDQTINLGGGKFLTPDKNIEVPDKLGSELIKRGCAIESQIVKVVAEPEDDSDEEKDDKVEADA